MELPQSAASGVLLAQGSSHAGWSFYVKDGKPKFAYNYLGNVTTITSAERLPAGRVTVGYDFVYDGGKPGSGGTGTIFVKGKKVATGRIERTIPFLFGAETADVGMDLYTPVTADYAKGNNQFTGKIDKVTIELKKTNAATEAAKKEAEEKEGEDALDED